MTQLYLAGPMTGYQHYNFPAFDNAAALLRLQGHLVFSPAEHDRESGFDAIAVDSDGYNAAEHGFDLRKALKADLSWICDYAEGVAVLDNWRHSKGALTEVALATALGIPVGYWNRWTPKGLPSEHYLTRL